MPPVPEGAAGEGEREIDWFKHTVDSHEDPDISDAEDEFGDAGYTVFFKILEVYGREFRRTNDQGELDLSKSKLSRNLRKKWKRIRLVLSFYHKRGRIIFTENEKRITFKIPKFIELASTWTKRQYDAPTEAPQQAPTEAPTAIEEEVRSKKKNKEKDTGVHFDKFWKTYPRKEAKKDARKAFKKLNPSFALLTKILADVGRRKISEAWTKDNGQFIPLAATYLRGERWEDQLDDPYEDIEGGFTL
jgi:hypothetical protein